MRDNSNALKCQVCLQQTVRTYLLSIRSNQRISFVNPTITYYHPTSGNKFHQRLDIQRVVYKNSIFWFIFLL